MRKLSRLLSVALFPAGALAAVGACKTAAEPPSSAKCGDVVCAALLDEHEPVVASDQVPPPISGGTLLITNDFTVAVVSDPDRDRIVVVDLDNATIRQTTDTGAGSEPGRAVESDDGVAYVALRRGGRVVAIDLATGSQIGATDVCPAPRGLAFDPASHSLHVACASGELVTFAARAGQLSRTRTVDLGDDLRDVVLSGSNLLVSHFRSASVDLVDPTGAKINQSGPAPRSCGELAFTPTVAWRMIAGANGSAFILHQQSQSSQLAFVDSAPLQGGSTTTSTGTGDPGDPSHGGYGGIVCGDAVHSQITELGSTGTPAHEPGAGSLHGMPVAVDLALSRPAFDIAVLSAGNGVVYESSITALPTRDGVPAGAPMAARIPPDEGEIDDGELSRRLPSSAEPIALAYGRDRGLVVQIREPSMLEVHDRATGRIARTIQLGGPSRNDTGHTMFHSTPDDGNIPLSCASCHPEGRDDGHVWAFQDGARRTASLAGFSTKTAPFHWRGDIADVGVLVDEIYTKRMSAQPQSSRRKNALSRFLDAMPAAPVAKAVDADSVARGAALFADATVGCATCHGGSLLTNNATVDVGTGGRFQVPSLHGISSRAPFMHDGCAPTLLERFNADCGGGDAHGKTSQLNENDLADLVNYMTTL